MENQQAAVQQDDQKVYVQGAEAGKEILEKLKQYEVVDEEPVIYGVYDNSGKGFMTKLNDFLIDHSRISLKDKVYFYHMLSMMVGAGIPVIAAVKSIAKHTENPHFRRILYTVSYDCDHGANLADSMSRFDNVFSEFELGVVRAGEESGRLNDMLHKLSFELEKRSDLSMKLWGAATYPLAVLAMLVVVSVGMLVWVLPTLLNLLEEGGIGGGDLPMATRILIVLQGVVVGYWWLILLVFFGLYGVFIMYIATSYGAVNWDFQKLRFPLVGRLLRKVYVLRFVAILGLLIDAGLPVIKALKISGNSIQNRIYKIKTQELIEFVRQGGKISECMEDTEFLYPPEVTQMLRVGEQSANLAKVSAKVAEQYQKEVDTSLKKLTSVFEPLMILFVGVFVALLALAIMAPIFNLSSVVGV